MKKQILILIAMLVGIAAVAKAMVVVYTTPIVTSAGLAYSSTYVVDTNQKGIDQLSAQAVYSSATISSLNFTDGTSSTGTITVSSNTRVNGQAIAIGSYSLLSGRDWAWTATSSNTAINICNAINSMSGLNAVVVATVTAGTSVVNATSSVTGSGTNYNLFSSTPAALVLSGATMTGGTDSAVSIANDTITSTNSFTLALPLLLTKNAGTLPTPLANNTTYYAIPVTATTFQLATTSTGAIAASPVNFTAQVSTGGGNFTLAPLSFVGSAAFKWQGSNDGTNYFDLAVASVTITSTTTANTSSQWDFAAYDYRFIRLNFVGPTSGAAALVVTPNGKNTYKNSNQ